MRTAPRKKKRISSWKDKLQTCPNFESCSLLELPPKKNLTGTLSNRLEKGVQMRGESEGRQMLGRVKFWKKSGAALASTWQQEDNP
jgi:hypothetical protein